MRLKRNKGGDFYVHQPMNEDQIVTWHIDANGEKLLRQWSIEEGDRLPSELFEELEVGGHLFTGRGNSSGSRKKSETTFASAKKSNKYVAKRKQEQKQRAEAKAAKSELEREQMRDFIEKAKQHSARELNQQNQPHGNGKDSKKQTPAASIAGPPKVHLEPLPMQRSHLSPRLGNRKAKVLRPLDVPPSANRIHRGWFSDRAFEESESPLGRVPEFPDSPEPDHS
jgi:hypothetical protein